VVVKSLFVRIGELSEDIFNRLDSEITMKRWLMHVDRMGTKEWSSAGNVCLKHRETELLQSDRGLCHSLGCGISGAEAWATAAIQKTNSVACSP
jgi:hypothetical protein